MKQMLGYVLAALWIGWFAYWRFSAFGVKASARQVPLHERLGYMIPVLVAAVLLIDPYLPPAVLDGRFLPDRVAVFAIGVAIVGAGLAVAVWARVVLGANWSGEMTVKQDHELILSGPYAFVRHPIYTGLGLAFLGTALAVGEWRGLIALAIALASFWYKLTVEERLMVETFGPAYADYRRRVAAVIPFLL